MKLDDILTEMPQNIPPLDSYYLNIPIQNEAQYTIFAANKYKKLITRLNNYAAVYKLGGQYVCLDSQSRQITYYMKYKVDSNGKLGQYVWQSLVWVNKTYSYTRGYPQKVFFEKLLPVFHTILTDSEQTWDGKGFWQLRITDAFDMNLNVYFYDFSTHNIVKMHNIQDFRQAQIQYDIWGDTDKHKMKRMIITDRELPIQRK